MALNITKGVRKGAVRTVIYGVEGIGKTTLAAKWPTPLFLDAEDGTTQLDVDRVSVPDWRAVEAALKELNATKHGYQTLVFDSIDWIEKGICDHMLKGTGKTSVEDYGYGKGYTILTERVAKFLAEVDRQIAAGVHVVFVAHAKTTKVSPPDQTDGYDKYELKLTKQTAPLIKEWADMLLFVNFQIQIVEGTDGRAKAQGGKERVMYATHSAAWDAKNRYGLPDCLPMDFKALAHVITGAPDKRPERVATVPEPVTQTKPEVKQEEPAGEPITASADQLAKLELYIKTPSGAKLISEYVAKAEAVDYTELSPEQAEELIKAVQAAMNAEPPKAQPNPDARPNPFSAWFAANAEKLNEFLAKPSVGFLKPGQTWEQLDNKGLDYCLDNIAGLAKAIKVAAPGGAK